MARSTGQILDDDEENDFASQVLDACGLDFQDFFFDERILTRENLEKNFNVIMKMVQNRSVMPAPYFVIGYFILVTGCKMPEDLRLKILKRTKPYYKEKVDVERAIYLKDFHEKIRVYKSSSKLHPIHLTYFNGDQELYDKHRDKVAIGISEFQRLCRSEEIYSREHIILQGWGLKAIPEQIFEIERLKSLSLEYNELTKVSDNILNLKSLKTLSLDYNHFKNFPEVLVNLPSLKFLSLDNNFISTIPVSIIKFNMLKNLFIRMNNFSKLPDFLSTVPFNIEYKIIKSLSD